MSNLLYCYLIKKSSVPWSYGKVLNVNLHLYYEGRACLLSSGRLGFSHSSAVPISVIKTVVTTAWRRHWPARWQQTQKTSEQGFRLCLSHCWWPLAHLSAGQRSLCFLLLLRLISSCYIRTSLPALFYNCTLKLAAGLILPGFVRTRRGLYSRPTLCSLPSAGRKSTLLV